MNYFRTLVILLAAVAVTGCWRSAQSRRDHFLESGNRYFNQAKYSEAEIEYRSALQIDPNSFEVHDRLAATYMKVGNWEAAVRELQRTIELHPGDMRAQLNLGNIYFVGQDLDRAEQIGLAVTQKDPSNAEAHSLLANVAEARGKHDEAMSEIARAIASKPDNADFYWTRGTFESNAEHLQAAEASYRKALEIDPKNDRVLIALSEIYKGQQRWEDAEKVLERCIAARPQLVQPRLELARLYLDQSRRDTAEQVLLQAQRDMPDNPEAYRLLPEFYSTIGATEKALSTFETLHRQHPKDLKTAKEYAQLLFSLRQVNRANDINEQVLASAPRDPDALSLKGQILTQQGKTDAAISMLRGVVNDYPTNAVTHYALGLALDASGDHHAAKNQWLQAAQLDPNMVDVQRVLAQVGVLEHDKVLLQQSAEQLINHAPEAPDGYIYRAVLEADNKQDDKAEADLNKSIQLAPQNAIGITKMAEWRLTRKRYAEAERLFEQALERDPNSFDALEGLVTTYKEQKRPEQMLSRVHTQIAKEPNNSFFYRLLAALQEDNRDFAGAEDSARKAISLDSSNNDAFELLGRVEVKQGAAQQALATSHEWIKRNPRYARAYLLTGSLEESKGNWTAAEELYRKAIELQPHYADAENNLAYLLLETGGNTDIALSLAQSAHNEAPNVPTISDTLAWAYYHKGLYKMSINLLEDALKAEPQNALYHFHIGLAYGKIDDRSQAKLHLRRALAIEPNSAQADLARKQLRDLGS
jgi:tetratricopeptide (TPR) repeat protein